MLPPHFMVEVQLFQGYWAITRSWFTFCHYVPRSSWCSFNWPLNDKPLSQLWSQAVVLNLGPLDWESCNIHLLQTSALNFTDLQNISLYLNKQSTVFTGIQFSLQKQSLAYNKGLVPTLKRIFVHYYSQGSRVYTDCFRHWFTDFGDTNLGVPTFNLK